MKLGRTGFGDLVPAMYPIPANPVMQAYYAQQQAQATAAKKPGMGLFVPAQFDVPENPVRRGVVNSSSNALGAGSFTGPKKLTGAKKNAVLSAHATLKSAGPTSSGVVGGVNGLGDFDTSSLSNFMNSLTSGTCTTPASCFSTYGIPNMVIVGGLALVVVMMMRSGGGGYHRR